MSRLSRTPQGLAPFEPGAPHSGYYNDLTVVLGPRDPAAALAHAVELTADRALANPVSIAQLGLGAWQRSHDDPAWLDTVAHVVTWIGTELEDDGTVPYHFPMWHTYELDPPWASAMAQGEMTSLLVRAAQSLGEPDLLGHAARTGAPLLDASLGLVAVEPEGPVLQEYPTRPPAHVLNGWIYGLWGVYDLAEATADPAAREAYDAGLEALVALLPRYTTGAGWSRYDLYPHPIVHVASPYYHKLHIAQLRALYRLDPRQELQAAATRWDEALGRWSSRALAVARKGAFRLIRPRSRARPR